MTIPRLELRAALLADRLLHRICVELDISIEECHAWCDSQIVMHWLRSDELTGNLNVDGYVHQIQEITPKSIWRYVATDKNPTDIASRGIDAKQLLHHDDWFHDPDWLKSIPLQWSHEQQTRLATPNNNADEENRQVLANIIELNSANYITRFSNLSQLLRFLTRLRRWIRKRFGQEPTLGILEPLTALELNAVFQACVRAARKASFSTEIALLKKLQAEGKGRELPGKGPLIALDPSVCHNGILRVGGRLEYSDLPFEARHAPILDGVCALAGLIISWAHTRALHGGFRSTYYYVLQRAWLIGGKPRIRRFTQHSVICTRQRASSMTQMMAALPPQRVTPIQAFARTGVDYSGPLYVLPKKGRGVQTIKIYVAVFVCMASKAIHLEAAGDLSTASFMGALKRFYGRRGKPAEIWSDNATNFHRVDIELREALNQESLKWGQVADQLAKEGISWNFIPASALHFGGFWEAAVRSFKTHFKQVHNRTTTLDL